MADYGQDPNNSAAAINNGGGGDLPPSNNPAAAALSLQRHPSIASTHSQSSKSSIVYSRVTNSSSSAAMFPASPALSTLSKNSSSGNSSLASSSVAAAANKMSVDDILSSSKLSLTGRQKRMRRQNSNSKAGISKPAGDMQRIRAPMVPSSSARPFHNAPLGRSKSTDRLASSAKRRLHTNPKYLTPGQEERKQRLQRLQQQQLRQSLSAGAHQQTTAKRKQPLKGLTKLEKMKQEEEEKLEQQEQQQQHQQHPEVPSSSSALHPLSLPKSDNSRASCSDASSNSIGASKRKQPMPDGTPSNDKAASVKSIIKPTPRRSKRAKTVTSYNVTELAKKNIISETTVSSSSSPAVEEEVTSSSPIEIKRKTQAKDTESVASSKASSGLPPPKQPEDVDEETEEEEPESATSALATLLKKYNACIRNTTNNEGQEVTPWSVVQLLTSVLTFINLHNPDFVKSDECKKVEAGLADILSSVERVKSQVMNRNNIGSGMEEADGQELDNIAERDAKLLQNIQIQVWMRMMVWSLEQEVGWEFLQRVIMLAESKAEADDSMMPVMESAKSKGKKKGKKKKSKKANGSKTHRNIDASSPRQCLVQEVQTLTELAPYVLPPSLDFAQWLKSTLTFDFRQTIPEYSKELFDHFEIEIVEPIALRRSGSANDNASIASRRSERSEVSHSPVKDNGSTIKANNGNDNAEFASKASPSKQMMEKRHMRQQAYFASLAEEEKASAKDDESATITGSLSTVTSTSKSSGSFREKDDAKLFQTSVSLTSADPMKSQNEFLKGSARGNYVANHFTSKLSNITTLFREVKAPQPITAKKKTKVKVSKKTAEKRRDNHEREQKLSWRDSLLSTNEPDHVEFVDKTGRNASAATSATSAASTVQPGRKSTNARTRLISSSPSKTTRFVSSSPARETPRKRPRPSTSSSNTDASAHGGGAHPLFQVEETPLRPIIEETPLAKQQKRSSRGILRFRDKQLEPIVEETPVAKKKQQRPRGLLGLRDDHYPHGSSTTGSNSLSNAIVAETPVQQQQQPPLVPVQPLIKPTTLWGAQDGQQHPRFNLSYHQGQRRQPQRGGNIGYAGGEPTLTPVNRYRGTIRPLSAASPSLSSGLGGMSPMPQQADLGRVVARAAKAARKKK